MPEKKKCENLTVTVLKQYKKGGHIVDDELDEEVIDVKAFPDNVEPAKVYRSYSLTVNLGNYESAKVSVGVTVPCYLEEMEDADKYAADFCTKRVIEERNEIKRM
jgi:hypothetical protein